MRTPSLRRHKPSARGVVTLNGRDIYLGHWPADRRKPPVEVQQNYDRAIAEWLAVGRQPATPTKYDLTIAELILAFWRHAEEYYRREDGTPTQEQTSYKCSLRVLRELYGELPANEFGPLKLKALRQVMIERGWCRCYINQSVGRIVRMFKWATSEELIAVEVYRGLTTVRGLERGRTNARESEPVLPVSDAIVEATLPHLLPPVAAMVQVQRLTGARPGEVCQMRGCDLDVSCDVWLYRPASHKTQHRGKQRIIAIGPKAQEVIRPFLRLATQAFLFSPREAVGAMRAAQRAARKTKVQPSQVCRKRRKPKRVPGERYTSDSYAHAISKSCEKNGIEHWHPHQLRHVHATEVRRKFGLEAAQVALGHATADVTQVYAERDVALAVSVAKAIG
jgi:integrase